MAWSPITIADEMRLKEGYDEYGEPIRVDLWVQEKYVTINGAIGFGYAFRVVNAYWKHDAWRDHEGKAVEVCIPGGRRFVTHFEFIRSPEDQVESAS